MITIDKHALTQALERCAAVAPTKSAVDILSAALVRVCADGFEVCATDLTRSIRVRRGTLKAPTEFAVNAKSALAAVRSLPGETVQLSLAHNELTLRSERRKFTLQTRDAAEFPAMQFGAGELKPIEFGAESFGSALSAVAHAMASDDSRPHLCATQLEIANGCLTAVATNGHCLAKHESAVDTSAALYVLIPAGASATIRTLCDVGGTIALSADESSVYAESAGVSIASKLVNAAFPAWRQVVPSSAALTLSIDRAALLDAALAVSLMGEDQSHALVLTASPEALTLESANPDRGSASDSVPCEVVGGKCPAKPERVGLSARYLSGALKAATSERVTLGLSGALEPVVLSAGDLVEVMMPMRV